MATVTTTPILQEVLQGRLQVVGLTIEQYDCLIEQGKLAEDPTTELIDGLIIQKDRSAAGENPVTVGDRHRIAVMLLARLDAEFIRYGCFAQSQQPIWLPPGSEPEPDLAVVSGRIEDYRDRKPGVSDIRSVVEVADSSLEKDLGTKLRVYAAAGIAEYIVVDLIDNVVLVHHQPVGSRYDRIIRLIAGDTLHISAGGANVVTIDVARLL